MRRVGIPEHEQRMPAIDQGALDAVVARMLGGSQATFFAEHFGKRPLYVPGAAVDQAGIYGVEQFLADMVATQPLPYLAVGSRSGNRYFTKHATPEDLRGAVQAGSVASMKMNKLWHGPDMPERWTWIRALFGSLCRAVSMIYMSPARSEDVDLFLAGPESQLGTHFDTTQVFTLQLFGERKWKVDEEVRLDNVLGLSRDPDWYPAKELEFQGATREITLRAGDALYVPAYAIHRVTGVSWSVSLSLGVRAFNEIDVVEHLLDAIRLTRYADYKPVPAVPEALGEPHVEAKLALMRKVRALLQQVEMAAMGAMMAPLELPRTLAGLDPGPPRDPSAAPILGQLASGFALLEQPKD